MKSFYRLFVFLFLLVAVYPLISYAGPPSIPSSGVTSYSQIKVGFYGNVFKETSAGVWFGESTGLCSTAESSAIFNFYKDATDSTGDSTGISGDYHNNSNVSAYNFIPSGKNVLPYDLDGKRRRTESDDAGCYVRGLKVY